MSDDVDLLKAQLVQCTKAMKEAINKLTEGQSEVGVTNEVIHLLATARGAEIPEVDYRSADEARAQAAEAQAKASSFAAVCEGVLDQLDKFARFGGDDVVISADVFNVIRDCLRNITKEPHQMERFRDGEWQRAKQEADTLRKEVKVLYPVRDELAEVKQQLAVTQHALVELRESVGYPNPHMDELKAQVAAEAQRATDAENALADERRLRADEQRGAEKMVTDADKQLSELKKQLATTETSRNRLSDSLSETNAKLVLLRQAIQLTATIAGAE